MQMVLVLFYAEQLKQRVLDLIQTTDKIRMASGRQASERVPKNSKDQVKKCLNALVADRVITTDQRDKIMYLIDYRNVIAHEVHELVGDLSADREILGLLSSTPRSSPSYDYTTVDSLWYFLRDT